MASCSGSTRSPGRSDRRVISAVHGAPEQLVSGEVRGSRYLLEPNAKVIEFDANDGPQLAHTDLRRLIALGNSVAAVFGGPQDVEWALAQDGKLWLLQSRPVTTEFSGTPARTDLRSRAGRGDLSRAPHRARVRSLGPAPP